MSFTPAFPRDLAAVLTLCGVASACAVPDEPVTSGSPPANSGPQQPVGNDQVSVEHETQPSGGGSSAGTQDGASESGGTSAEDVSMAAPPTESPLPPTESGGTSPGASSDGPEGTEPAPGADPMPMTAPPANVNPEPTTNNPPADSTAGSLPDPPGPPATVQDIPPDLGGLCTVAIDCNRTIRDEPKIGCEMAVHDVAGTLLYQGHAGVEQRGRSSQVYPKKSYAIELRLANGEENPVGMLKMGKEADWILDASWLDRSFMRNQLTSDLFAEVGPTHVGAEGRFCTLTLNQRRQGIYRLVEKLKRDDDRIDIAEDDGTGQSFVIKQDDEGILSMPIRGGRSIKLGATWQAVYPKQARALPAQLDGIQRWLDGLSTANDSGDGSLFSDYLDVTTTADWILFQELSKNIDGYDLSIYIFRDSGGLAHMIPWDFDLAYGHPTLQLEGNETPAGWIRHRSDFIQSLIATPGFLDTLKARWSVLRAGVLTEESINAKFDSYLQVLSPESIAENFSLWPIEDVEFRQIYSLYSLYRVDSHEEEVARLRQWIFDRMLWMDGNLASIIDAEDLPDRAERF